jgi:hypothetical protein
MHRLHYTTALPCRIHSSDLISNEMIGVVGAMFVIRKQKSWCYSPAINTKLRRTVLMTFNDPGVPDLQHASFGS